MHLLRIPNTRESHAGRALEWWYSLQGRGRCCGDCIVDFLWMFGIRNKMAGDRRSSARISLDL
jgi:hypothetical protein